MAQLKALQGRLRSIPSLSTPTAVGAAGAVVGVLYRDDFTGPAETGYINPSHQDDPAYVWFAESPGEVGQHNANRTGTGIIEKKDTTNQWRAWDKFRVGGPGKTVIVKTRIRATYMWDADAGVGSVVEGVKVLLRFTSPSDPKQDAEGVKGDSSHGGSYTIFGISRTGYTEISRLAYSSEGGGYTFLQNFTRNYTVGDWLDFEVRFQFISSTSVRIQAFYDGVEGLDYTDNAFPFNQSYNLFPSLRTDGSQWEMDYWEVSHADGSNNAPTAPTLSAATNVLSTSFTTNWAASGGTTYVVERRPAGGTWATVGTTNLLSYNHTGLAPNTTYEVRVSGRNMGLAGPVSIVQSTSLGGSPYYLYEQYFSTDTAGWVAENANATSLARDTSRDPQGALRYTQSGAGGTGTNGRVISPIFAAGQAGTSVTVQSRVSHTDTVARFGAVQLWGVTASGGFVEHLDQTYPSIAPGEDFTALTATVTPQSALSTHLRALVIVQGLAAGAQVHVGEVLVTGTAATQSTPVLASPATNITSSGFVSSWAGSGWTDYLVQRRLTGGSTWTTVATVTGTTYNHTGLAASTGYDVRIVPRLNGTEGAASNTVATTTGAAASYLYEQTFGTDAGGWVTETNATNIVRDATRDTQGALRFEPTAAGYTRVRAPSPFVAAPIGVARTISARVSHTHTSAVSITVQLWEYATSTGTFLNQLWNGLYTSVPAGTGFTSLTGTYTPNNASTTHIRALVAVQSLDLGAQVHVAEVTIA